MTKSVFISHTSDDTAHAAELADSLTRAGFAVHTGESMAAGGGSLQESIAAILDVVETLVVLLGPKTRFSKWIDWEIETALSPGSPNGRGPCALLAIILPEHGDFSKPYYDPENVPVRLHDALQWESALIRKWDLDPDTLAGWIEDACARRKRVPHPRASFPILSQLSSFAWDESVDNERFQK